MKNLKFAVLLAILLAPFLTINAQEDSETQLSNVQEFTPSKLLRKGQWDIKFFNSIYTQTSRTDEGSNSVDIPRETFFTNTTEVFTGVSDSRRLNVGLIFQVRANNFGGSTFDALSFENNTTDARSGLTTIAPSIRVQPIASISNFSITSSLFIPLFEDVPSAPFLDKRSFFWETKFFYDKTFGGDKWQIFTEVDLGYNFGEDSSEADPTTENVTERFANESLFVPASAFLSYFPTSKSTVFVNAQQGFLIDLGNEFSQNFTQVGFGGKYQLTDILNVEASYGKFVRGDNFQGLGETYSIGLRAILN